MQNALINTGPTNEVRPRVFIVVLFAIKPFIDLTWNIPLFSIGGVVLNPLRITGFCVFIIAGYLHFFQSDNKRIFNECIIWLFLGLNLFTSIIAVFFYNRPVILVMDVLLKLFDSYFIYFIGHRYIKNDRDKLRIISIIWISTLLVSILSIMQYSLGVFIIDISQGVERFAGLYNDPGTPSYNAIMSLIFGTLYLELYKRQRQIVPSIIVKITFILTLLATALILKITLTKSALLMLIVFLAMWIGLYKQKSYIVIPILIIGAYCIFVTSEAMQLRIAPELEFLAKGGRSMEEARHLGEGRIAVWERLLIYYNQDYDFFQKFFGSMRSFGAHNQYIAYLMQVGLVGLTVFLIILLKFYRQLIHLYRKYKQPEIYMSIVLLTIFTVYGLTGHPFYYTTFLWYLMILVSSVNV